MSQCLCEAILRTYRIGDDDDGLRASPTTFEKQRGEYPVRREFAAFTVNLKNGAPKIEYRLKALGFSISSQ
jgi:erythronate-4-phosphate dehydrogenase